MAITCTHIGNNQDASGGTTGTAFSPASNLSAGSLAVLIVALNNSESGGVAYATLTATDSEGNTWTRQRAPLYDPGTADQGIAGAIFTTPMDGGTLTTGSTITITTSTATTYRSSILWQVTPTSGSFDIGYVNGGDGTGANTGSPSVITGSITSGNIVIAALFVEWNQVPTADSDTTNGNWSTQESTGGGSGNATGIRVASQYKVVTGTATQTYNPTLGTAADCITAWIQLTETANSGIAATDSFAFTSSAAMSANASVTASDTTTFTSAMTDSAQASVAASSSPVFVVTAGLSSDTSVPGWASINGWWMGWTLSSPATVDGSIAATDSFAFTVSAAMSAQAAIAATDSFAFTATAAVTSDASIAATSAFAFTVSAAMSAQATITATDSFAFTCTSSIAEIGGGETSGTCDVAFTATCTMSATAGITATDSFAFTATSGISSQSSLSGTCSATFTPSCTMSAIAEISCTTFPTFSTSCGISRVSVFGTPETGWVFGREETVWTFQPEDTVFQF